MRSYYEKIEDNLHVPEGTAGHGFGGYLGVDVTKADVVETGPQRVANGRGIAQAFGKFDRAKSTDWDVIVTNDINNGDVDRDTVSDPFEMPFKVGRKGHRSNAASRLNGVFNAGYPLTVRSKSLASHIILDENPKAVGVEYLEGEKLYRADPSVGKDDNNNGIPRRVYAPREVIVGGGAFNSPQILLQSGIGPKEELEKLDIPAKLDLPECGQESPGPLRDGGDQQI